jgi:hypothetical protein
MYQTRPCFDCSNVVSHKSRPLHFNKILNSNHKILGSVLLTAVVRKSSIICDITSCSPLKINRRFGKTYLLNLKYRKIISAHYLLDVAFLIVILGDLKNRSNIFLRNVAWFSLEYTALYRRWKNSSVENTECALRFYIVSDKFHTTK